MQLHLVEAAAAATDIIIIYSKNFWQGVHSSETQKFLKLKYVSVPLKCQLGWVSYFSFQLIALGYPNGFGRPLCFCLFVYCALFFFLVLSHSKLCVTVYDNV